MKVKGSFSVKVGKVVELSTLKITIEFDELVIQKLSLKEKKFEEVTVVLTGVSFRLETGT